MSELSQVKKFLNLLRIIVGFKNSDKIWVNRCVLLTNLNLAVTIVMIFVIGGLNVTDIISFTGYAQIVAINTMFISTTYKFYSHKKLLDESLEWCSTRYRQIDCCNRNIAEKAFDKISKLSFIVLRVPCYLLLLSNSLIAAGILLSGLTSNDSQYLLALPYHLPFYKPHNTFTYFVNWAQQSTAGYQENFYFCLMTGQIFVIMTHILQQCKMIETFVSEMDHVTSQASFKSWLKNVVDLTWDVKRLWAEYCKLSELPLFFLEMTTYATIFIVWVVFKVEPSSVHHSAPYLVILGFSLVFAFINEMMLEKFDNILEALCNVEWYTRSPKERRELLPVLLFLQRPPCLKSGGMKEITFNWFLQLLKSAYSTGLILLSFIE